MASIVKYSTCGGPICIVWLYTTELFPRCIGMDVRLTLKIPLYHTTPIENHYNTSIKNNEIEG